MPKLNDLIELFRKKGLTRGKDFEIKKEGIFLFVADTIAILKDKVETLTLNIRTLLDVTEEGFVYSPPNMALLEALEEYYELHREEIEKKVAALKEELRQTIRRYEGKRLWLRGKTRMRLESKKLFLAELDAEYPEL